MVGFVEVGPQRGVAVLPGAVNWLFGRRFQSFSVFCGGHRRADFIVDRVEGCDFRRNDLGGVRGFQRLFDDIVVADDGDWIRVQSIAERPVRHEKAA